MNLIDFLEWENDHGIYRSEVDGEFYRVVNNKLEIYDPGLLEWEECDLPMNKYSKLQSVEEVGIWTEGIAVHNEEEWQLVKNYYLSRNHYLSGSVRFAVDNYLEDGVVFYVFPYCGHIQAITNTQIVKRDLILKPIDWELKFHAKYAGTAKFYDEMYWQMEGNRREVSLVEKGKVVSWNSMGMLGTLRDWKRCGITERDAVFIPIGSDEIRRNAT